MERFSETMFEFLMSGSFIYSPGLLHCLAFVGTTDTPLLHFIDSSKISYNTRLALHARKQMKVIANGTKSSHAVRSIGHVRIYH